MKWIIFLVVFLMSCGSQIVSNFGYNKPISTNDFADCHDNCLIEMENNKLGKNLNQFCADKCIIQLKKI